MQNGSGSEAQFNSPCGMALAEDGTLFVADKMNNCIRSVSTTGKHCFCVQRFIFSAGEVSTYAGTGTPGSDDGAAIKATFCHPIALAYDRHDSSLYVSDREGQLIRKINNGTVSDNIMVTHLHTGQVRTIAGDKTSPMSNSFARSIDGNLKVARFGKVPAMAVFGNSIFLADQYKIRKLAL